MRERWFSLTVSGWHDVVAGYVREGLIEQALEGLDDMRNAQVDVQSWLYDMLVYMLCELKELDEALNIMTYRIRINQDRASSSVWYYLLDTACTELHVCAGLTFTSTRTNIAHSTTQCDSFGKDWSPRTI